MARTPKFDEHEILDRAMTHLWQHGWSGSSIRDLEGALDLRAPSIYRRFGTKEGLGVAVVEHYVDRVVRRRVVKHLDRGGDPIDNLRNFLERSVTESENGGRLWGCLLTTTSMEWGGSTDRLAHAVSTGLLVIEDGIRAQVVRAEAEARLAEGVDVEAAVATLALAMQGLMTLARSGHAPADLRQRARAVVSVISGVGPTR